VFCGVLIWYQIIEIIGLVISAPIKVFEEGWETNYIFMTFLSKLIKNVY